MTYVTDKTLSEPPFLPGQPWPRPEARDFPWPRHVVAFQALEKFGFAVVNPWDRM